MLSAIHGNSFIYAFMCFVLFFGSMMLYVFVVVISVAVGAVVIVGVVTVGTSAVHAASCIIMVVRLVFVFASLFRFGPPGSCVSYFTSQAIQCWEGRVAPGIF